MDFFTSSTTLKKKKKFFLNTFNFQEGVLNLFNIIIFFLIKIFLFFQKIYLENIFIREGFLVLLVIKIVTKKMFSSESEESDNDIGENFDHFLYAKNHKYEWKDLEFDGLEKHLA